MVSGQSGKYIYIPEQSPCCTGLCAEWASLLFEGNSHRLVLTAIQSTAATADYEEEA